MPGTNLTRDEARERATVVGNVAYDVRLDLTTGPTTFLTSVTVTFAATPGAATFIDFVGERVERITLNGRTLDPSASYQDSRIQLDELAAENVLQIDAVGQYTNTGEGLHRFADPADGEVYLYTQFETADSRRMFPVFEQPDLKAAFTFTVTGPAQWQVISCSPTPEPTDAGMRDGIACSTWAFEPTPRISSYITALIAGPYDVVRDTATTRAGQIPLGIFSRKSLTPHLDADEIFAITKAGFTFFEDEFDVDFPFSKYDQVFTPEYNMGAMENVAAVTINEIYIFRSKVTEALVERRASTILHELAHMWFGDLVTMTWWDDLWLNESFAEWASISAQAQATRWTGAWTTFAIAEKAWAYRQDQLSSTHPIAADITDLQDVETNFDGITYAKGASVVKQLVAYVGQDAFVAGLRSYFTKFAWKNATLTDLLTELEAASGRDLTAWSKLWLQTAGVNTLTPELECDADGTMTRVALVQTASAEHPTLRPQRLLIGLYDLRDGAFVRRDQVEVEVDGERTEVAELAGVARPDLLLVNDDDLGYAKVRFDPQSLTAFIAHPNAFTDSLPRTIALATAWDMARDGEMPARDYLRLALDAIGAERDSTSLRLLLAQTLLAVQLYVAPDARAATRAEVVTRLRELLDAAESGSDAQLQLITALATLSNRDSDLDLFAALLDGTGSLAGLSVDADLTWTLATSLAAAGRIDEARIEALLEADRTANGRQSAAQALGALPTGERKAAAWQRGVVEHTESNKILQYLAIGFGRIHDVSLLEPYRTRYFEDVETAFGASSFALGEIIAGDFFPMALADQDLLDRTQAWLDEHPSAPSSLLRVISEHRDALRRALQAQQVDAGAQQPVAR